MKLFEISGLLKADVSDTKNPAVKKFRSRIRSRISNHSGRLTSFAAEKGVYTIGIDGDDAVKVVLGDLSKIKKATVREVFELDYLVEADETGIA